MEKIEIDDDFSLEIFFDDSEFFREVKGSDFCFKTGDDMVAALNKEKLFSAVGDIFVPRRKNTLQNTIGAIISKIHGVKSDYKWIRLCYKDIEFTDDECKYIDAVLVVEAFRGKF